MNGLRWSENKHDQMILAIQNRKRKFASSGCSCVYFPISKLIGVKIYQSKRERDSTHSKQLYASKFGLAPLVGDQFSFNCINVHHDMQQHVTYKTVYGYLTQNVQVPKRLCEKLQYKLQEELEQIGLINDDLYYGNVGWIGNRLVCIDFDPCSCRWKNNKVRR